MKAKNDVRNPDINSEGKNPVSNRSDNSVTLEIQPRCLREFNPQNCAPNTMVAEAELCSTSQRKTAVKVGVGLYKPPPARKKECSQSMKNCEEEIAYSSSKQLKEVKSKQNRTRRPDQQFYLARVRRNEDENSPDSGRHTANEADSPHKTHTGKCTNQKTGSFSPETLHLLERCLVQKPSKASSLECIPTNVQDSPLLHVNSVSSSISGKNEYNNLKLNEDGLKLNSPETIHCRGRYINEEPSRLFYLDGSQSSIRTKKYNSKNEDSRIRNLHRSSSNNKGKYSSCSIDDLALNSDSFEKRGPHFSSTSCSLLDRTVTDPMDSPSSKSTPKNHGQLIPLIMYYSKSSSRSGADKDHKFESSGVTEGSIFVTEFNMAAKEPVNVSHTDSDQMDDSLEDSLHDSSNTHCTLHSQEDCAPSSYYTDYFSDDYLSGNSEESVTNYNDFSAYCLESINLCRKSISNNEIAAVTEHCDRIDINGERTEAVTDETGDCRNLEVADEDSLHNDGEREDVSEFGSWRTSKYSSWVEEVDNCPEDSWDTLYDESGNCLDSAVQQELNDAIGNIALEYPTNDYHTFKPEELPDINEDYGHIIEIYDFDPSFKTQDLLVIFQEFRGFDLKWVDDTHALGIFATPHQALQSLNLNHPFVRTRPLTKGISASKSRAYHLSLAQCPYKTRPETSVALARRLVSGALGLKVQISKEQRDAERMKLKVAKEQKRLIAQRKEEAWEGTLANIS